MPLSFRLPAILAALPGRLAMLPVPLRTASSDAELKAACVCNVTRFVDWPADALAAAKRANLVLSSNLLRLARQVRQP